MRLMKRPTQDSQVDSWSPCLSLKGKLPIFSVRMCSNYSSYAAHDLTGGLLLCWKCAFSFWKNLEYETQVLRKVPYREFSLFPRTSLFQREKGINRARDELLLLRTGCLLWCHRHKPLPACGFFLSCLWASQCLALSMTCNVCWKISASLGLDHPCMPSFTEVLISVSIWQNSNISSVQLPIPSTSCLSISCCE